MSWAPADPVRGIGRSLCVALVALVWLASDATAHAKAYTNPTANGLDLGFFGLPSVPSFFFNPCEDRFDEDGYGGACFPGFHLTSRPDGTVTFWVEEANANDLGKARALVCQDSDGDGRLCSGGWFEPHRHCLSDYTIPMLVNPCWNHDHYVYVGGGDLQVEFTETVTLSAKTGSPPWRADLPTYIWVYAGSLYGVIRHVP